MKIYIFLQDIEKPLTIIEKIPLLKHIINNFSCDSSFEFCIVSNQIFDLEFLNCVNISIIKTSYKKCQDIILEIQKYILDDDEIILTDDNKFLVWDFNLFLRDMKDSQSDSGIPCYKGYHPYNKWKKFIKQENYWMKSLIKLDYYKNHCKDDFVSMGPYYFKKGSILKSYLQYIKNDIKDIYEYMIIDNLKIRIYQIYKLILWDSLLNIEEYLRWSNYFQNRPKSVNNSFNFEIDKNINVDDYNTYLYYAEFFIPKQISNRRIIVWGYPTIGDYLSCNGLIHYLSQFYSSIHYCTFKCEYLEILYKDILHKMEISRDLCGDEYTDFINTTLKITPGIFKEKFDKKRYYDKDHKFPFPGIQLYNIEYFHNPLNDVAKYYNSIGFLKELRLTYFRFERLLDKEFLITKMLYDKNNISYIINNTKIINTIPYLVINDESIIPYLNSSMTFININFSVDNPLLLLSVIENSFECHMVENSTVLMMYYTQFNDMLKIKTKNVFIYGFLRFRGHEILNLLRHPELDNWIFIKDKLPFNMQDGWTTIKKDEDEKSTYL